MSGVIALEERTSSSYPIYGKEVKKNTWLQKALQAGTGLTSGSASGSPAPMSQPTKILDDLGLDPAILAFLAARAAANPPAVHETPVHDLRAGVETAQAKFTGKQRALSDDIEIPAGPLGKVPVRLLRPVSVPGKLPIVVYLHGGGWVTGSLDSHDRLARDIMAASGAALAVVDYSRSPESRYPVALEQTYAVTAWLAENGGVLGLDGSRLAVAGDSSGANLAAAAVLLAKRRNGPAIRHQTLLYPAADAACASGSYQQFENGPNLTREAMLWYWDQYAPDQAAKVLDTVSIVNVSVDDLRGFPPSLVITAEYDVLRDEAEAYAGKLIRAGVPVTASRFLGTIHGFLGQNALAEIPAARSAVAQIGAALRAALA